MSLLNLTNGSGVGRWWCGGDEITMTAVEMTAVHAAALAAQIKGTISRLYARGDLAAALYGPELTGVVSAIIQRFGAEFSGHVQGLECEIKRARARTGEYGALQLPDFEVVAQTCKNFGLTDRAKEFYDLLVRIAAVSPQNVVVE